MSTQRIYFVDNSIGEVSLVRADNQASARNFIARQQIEVRLATQQDLVDLVGAGCPVLETRGQPEEVEA
jgi:hypothetical protein